MPSMRQVSTKKIVADNRMSELLTGLRISLEAYPDLKTNINFLHLQNEIADTENKLTAARRFFNSATRELKSGATIGIAYCCSSPSPSSYWA